jgi:hypothetical protein
MEDLCEAARDGDIDTIDVAIYEDRDVIDLYELAMCAIDGDQLLALIYLIDQGVKDIHSLYNYAVNNEKWDIVQYLGDIISSEETTHTALLEETSLLEDMVRDNDIDQVREMMNEKITTPEEVAILAVKYDNRPLLISALKRGASDYDAMIKVAKEEYNNRLVRYLEKAKEADLEYYK